MCYNEVTYLLKWFYKGEKTMELQNRIFQELMQMPTTDLHTHIRVDVPVARGLADIMLYHMIITELYSAGCPDGARLSNYPTEEECEYRITRAIPYLKYIKNTALYHLMTVILKDIYGWEKEITLENWRTIDKIIKDKGCTIERAKKIASMCGVVSSNTEIERCFGHKADELFNYSLDWSFFTRARWGQYDTALLELEYSWNQDYPGPPLPVTIDRSTLKFEKVIRTIEDVDTALDHYIEHMPFDEIANMTSHLSTDINYRAVTREEMVSALALRDTAGETERDVYANYVCEGFLSRLEKKRPGFTLQYSIGAEPLPFETGSKLRTDTVSALADQAARYPSLNFAIYSASEHQDQAFCTLVRELPNVSIAGYWWHCFFPEKIRRILADRLDMLPTNKQHAFFSDAYCMDWTYGKAYIVKKQLASVLAERIESGRYTYDEAMEIAHEILN